MIPHSPLSSLYTKFLAIFVISSLDADSTLQWVGEGNRNGNFAHDVLNSESGIMTCITGGVHRWATVI